MMCERCGQREAVAQQCPGDYADHGHGSIHIMGGGLLAVCHPCGAEAAREWGTVKDDHGRYVRRAANVGG